MSDDDRTWAIYARGAMDEETAARLGLGVPAPKPPTLADVARETGVDEEELAAWRGARRMGAADLARREVAELRRQRDEAQARRIRERVAERERRGD